MDATITFLLLALALVLVGAMVFAQIRHKHHAQSREKLMHLSTENKKLQALLRSLPGNYLSLELRDFIYRTLISNYKQMLSLDKGNSKFLQSDLDDVIAQRKALHAGTLPIQGESLTNIEQANSARAGLKALYQYIKIAFEHKHLTKTEAQSLLDEIESRLVETGADFFAARAELSLRQKRYREAMSLWRKAMETYSKSRLAGQYQQKISEARSRIRYIQNEWKEANRERSEEQAKVMQEKMDAWTAEQDQWKKKHLYDDDI